MDNKTDTDSTRETTQMADPEKTDPEQSDKEKLDTDTARLIDPDPDLTLAQQIAENERQMYERSQQMLQEIEDEVFFLSNYLKIKKHNLKVRKTQPLVSSKQDIIHLVAEFDEKTSPQYFKKAMVLLII